MKFKINIIFIFTIFIIIVSCNTRQSNETKTESNIDGSAIETDYKFNETIIGNQIWSANNLNVSKFRNGDEIFHAESNSEWANAGKSGLPAWCYHLNLESRGKIYGKLYNWYAVNDKRGLAPDGWHIASDQEWTKLTGFLGGFQKAGQKLKSVNGWDDNGGGTNQVGFNGMPGGFRSTKGEFLLPYGGYDGFYWTSTEGGSNNAWIRKLDEGSTLLKRDNALKAIGYSVRCIKN